MKEGRCEVINCSYVGPLAVRLERDGLCAHYLCPDCFNGVRAEAEPEQGDVWNDWPPQYGEESGHDAH